MAVTQIGSIRVSDSSKLEFVYNGKWRAGTFRGLKSDGKVLRLTLDDGSVKSFTISKIESNINVLG